MVSVEVFRFRKPRIWDRYCYEIRLYRFALGWRWARIANLFGVHKETVRNEFWLWCREDCEDW